ncbi:MAG: MarR family transcriptional regulator [Flavobacteriaceae bacterium]
MIPVSKKIILNVMYAQNIIADKLMETLKPYDISIEQFNVLRILRGQKGKPVNMGFLQEQMIAKTSNTTRLVDKLLLKELVDRQICSENRRKMEVTITEKGLELLDKVDELVDETEENIVAVFGTQEQEQLLTLLEKFKTPTI